MSFADENAVCPEFCVEYDKPNPDLLLDYEQKLFDVKAKLESCKTPVKDKYIKAVFR